MGNKWAEICEESDGLDCIALTEIWLDDRIKELLCPKIYHNYRQDREDRRIGGGVVLLIVHQYQQLQGIYFSSPCIKTVSAKVILIRRKINIACVYQIPAAPAEENDQLLDFLRGSVTTEEEVLLMRDLDTPRLN